jgi:hypothetical protein
MTTARAWAEASGFVYEFVDDRLFEYAPLWYREKVGHNKLLVSDLARLKLAREFLDAGYDRTIWIDADVLVFDPSGLTVDVTDQYAFCREIWLSQKPGEPPVCSPERVNNSVSVFVGGNSILDFLIYAGETLVRNATHTLRAIDVGTNFLCALHQRIRLPLLHHVGTLSPTLLSALRRSAIDVVHTYMAGVNEPLFAANLCGSFGDASNHGVALDERHYERVVDALLQSHGELLNSHLEAGRGALQV